MFSEFEFGIFGTQNSNVCWMCSIHFSKSFCAGPKHFLQSTKFSTKAKKWVANGVLEAYHREHVYYIPLQNSVTKFLMPKIESGEYVMFYGPRASSKSTHVEEAIELLTKQEYFCFKIDFQLLNFDNLHSFWESFGHQIQKQKRISSPLTTHIQILEAFSNRHVFRKNKKVALFIDDFDALLHRDHIFMDSVLTVLRGWKHVNKQKTALHSVVAVGPFNIKHLSGKNISPFNARDTVAVPFFPEAEFYELFNQFCKDRSREIPREIDPEIAKDIYARTEGHPGLTCFCCKMLDERLQMKKVSYMDWLNYAVTKLPAATVNENIPVRRMVETLQQDKVKPARELLRKYFLPVATPPQLNDNELVQQAEFLAGEGILLQNSETTYRLLSPLVKVALMEKVLPVDKLPVPNEPVPFEGNRLNIPAIIGIAIKYFGQSTMQSYARYSFKIANTRGLIGQKVPHEFAYHFSLWSVFHGWLPGEVVRFPEVVATNFVQEDNVKSKLPRCGVFLNNGGTKYWLEILATGDLEDIRAHIDQALLYKKAFDAEETWLIHFTCSPNPYLKEALPCLKARGIKMMTIQHDLEWTQATTCFSNSTPMVKVNLN